MEPGSGAKIATDVFKTYFDLVVTCYDRLCLMRVFQKTGYVSCLYYYA